MSYSPSSSPFTLEEFADLVSAALDPQHSPCTSSNSSPSPSSSFLCSPSMSFAKSDASDAHGGKPIEEMSPRLTLPWIQDQHRPRQHQQQHHHHNDNYSDPVKRSSGRRCPTRNTFHDERKLDLPQTHLSVTPSFSPSSANTASTFTPTPSTPQGNNDKLLPTPTTTPPTVLITPPPPQHNHTESKPEPQQRRRSCVKFALSHQIPIPPPPPIPDYTTTIPSASQSPSAPRSRSMPLLYAPPAPLPIGETPFPPIIAATMSSVDLGHCLEFEGVSGCAGVVRERSKSRERSRERSRLRARSSMPVEPHETSLSTSSPTSRDTLRIPIRSSPIRSERGPVSPSKRPTPTPLAVAASPTPSTSTSHAKSSTHKSSKLNLKISAHTKSSAPISPVSPTKSTPNPLALFARIKRQLSRNNIAAGRASLLHSASCPTTPISGSGFNYPTITTTSGLPSPSSPGRMPSEDVAPGPPVELGLEYRYDNAFDYQFQLSPAAAVPSAAVPFPASPPMTIPSALVSSNSYLSLSGRLADVESSLGTGTGSGSGSGFKTALDSGFRSGPGSGVESGIDRVDTASDVSMSTSRGGRRRKRRSGSGGKRDRDSQAQSSATESASGSARENSIIPKHHQPTSTTRPSRALGGSIFGIKNYYDPHERDYEYDGYGYGSCSNSSSPSRYSCDSAPLGMNLGADGDEYSIIGSSCSFFLELRGREAARGFAGFEAVGAEMLREGSDDVEMENDDVDGYKPYVPLVIQHEREKQRLKEQREQQQEKQHGVRNTASMASLKSAASSKQSRSSGTRSKSGASAPSSQSSSDGASSRRRRANVPHPLPLPVSSARSTTLPSPPPSPPGPPPRFSRSLSVSSTESGPPITPCTPLFVVTDAEGRSTMGMDKRNSRVLRVSMEEESEPVVKQARQIGVSRPIAFSIPPASPTQQQQPIQAHISTPGTTSTHQNPSTTSPKSIHHTTVSPPPSPQTQTLTRVKTRSRQSVAIHAAVPLSPPPMGPLPLPPPLRAAAHSSVNAAAARAASGNAHISSSTTHVTPVQGNERVTSVILGAGASPILQEGMHAAETTNSAHIHTNGNVISGQRRNSASTTTSSCVLGSILTSRSSSTSNYASASGSRARSVSLSSSSFAAVATAGAFLPVASSTASISDGSSILTSTQEEDDDDAAAARVLAANTLANANRNRHMSLIGGSKKMPAPVPLIGVVRQIVRRGSTKAIEEDGVGEWTLLLGASDERRVKKRESVIKMRSAGRMLSVPTALGTNSDAAEICAERMRTKSESALRRSSPVVDSKTDTATASGQDWTLSLPGLRNKKSLIRAAEIVISPAVSSPAIDAPVSTCTSEDEDALCVPRVVSLGSGIDSSAVSASLVGDEEDDNDALSSIAPREANGTLENLHKLEKDLEKFNAMLLRTPSLGLVGKLKHAKSCGVLPGVDEPPPKNAVLRNVEVFTDAVAAGVGAMASTLSVPSQQSVKRMKSTATLRIDTSSGATAATVRRALSTSSTKSSSSSSAELTPTALNPPAFNTLSSSQTQTQPPAQLQSQPHPQTRPPSLKESDASPSPRTVQRDSTLSVGSSNDVYFSDSSVSGEFYSARSSFTSALSPEV